MGDCRVALKARRVDCSFALSKGPEGELYCSVAMVDCRVALN